MLASSVLTLPWVPSPSDGVPSPTLDTQLETEEIISKVLTAHMSSFSPPTLDKAQHLNFLTRIIRDPLSVHYTGLDASRPWLMYWAIHSLALFGADLDLPAKRRVVDTLAKCQNPDGGFGGGPGQLSHLAPSYAAVLALSYVGEDGFKMINRRGMYNFFLKLKQPDGSFIMHIGGEVDVRGCYCALTVATLLNILTPALALKTSSFIASCQTYEGGLASSSHPFASSSPHAALAPPLGEAHGGYAFCAAATYSMLRAFDSPTSPANNTSSSSKSGKEKELDLGALTRWATSMQAMPIEGGGFRGRTNKLVDGCYSWWGGGLFGVLGGLLDEEAGADVGELYDRSALQEYILLVAQSPTGGLRDKPGKPADAYHTCYNLSGLSSSQHRPTQSPALVDKLRKEFKSPFAARLVVEGEPEIEVVSDEGESAAQVERRMREVWARSIGWEDGEKLIVGNAEDNEMVSTHPIFNLTRGAARVAMEYFYQQSQ
ncbi:hypothetical protein RQP46_009424 [Phenoliferia psychrophenolica]